jgi:hypothetical protein
MERLNVDNWNHTTKTSKLTFCGDEISSGGLASCSASWSSSGRFSVLLLLLRSCLGSAGGLCGALWVLDTGFLSLALLLSRLPLWKLSFRGLPFTSIGSCCMELCRGLYLPRSLGGTYVGLDWPMWLSWKRKITTIKRDIKKIETVYAHKQVYKNA